MKKIIAELCLDREICNEVEGTNLETAFGWLEQSGFQYQTHIEIPKESHMNKLYQLIETVEGSDGIRDYHVLSTSWNKQKLRDMMKEKIEDDVYGYISRNGILDEDDDCFETKYDYGFVKYDIIEVEVIE